MGIPEMLSLDTPWALGEAKYAEIRQLVMGRSIIRIAEFGSGISTVRMAMDFPKAVIWSVESSSDFYQQSSALLARYRIDNVRILHCPLIHVRFGLRRYLTYSIDTGQLGDSIDFALIDGPVEAETLMGREAVLYIIFPFLVRGALVVLDDYHRSGAKRVVRNWLSLYGQSLEMVTERDRWIALRKTGDSDGSLRPSIFPLLDNLCVNAFLALRAIKRAFIPAQTGR